MALLAAAGEGDVDSLVFFLSKKINPNVRDDKGRTPLHYAAAEGQAGCVDALLRHGAEADALSMREETALFEAARGSNATSKTGKDAALVLLQAGADVNRRNVEEMTPLHAACGRRGSGLTVQVLVGAGADVNAMSGKGLTPLHLACLAGYESVVDLLINRGADVNRTDIHPDARWTPLHYAAERGWGGVCERLVKAGATLNQPNAQGHMPLHLACRMNRVAAVRVLLKAGADVCSRDDKGLLPEQLTQDNAEITTLLASERYNKKRDTGFDLAHAKNTKKVEVPTPAASIGDNREAAGKSLHHGLRREGRRVVGPGSAHL